jgi:hypothetical protein
MQLGAADEEPGCGAGQVIADGRKYDRPAIPAARAGGKDRKISTGMMTVIVLERGFFPGLSSVPGVCFSIAFGLLNTKLSTRS